MLFEDKLHDILNTLESGKLLLSPAEFAWGMLFDYKSDSARALINQLDSAFEEEVFVFMKDIIMLKDNLPDLHPRIETLLLHHRRPLGIITSNETFGTMESYCLAFDPYLHSIIRLLDRPLGCLYCSKNALPVGLYKDIRNQYKDAATYISKHRKDDVLSAILPNNASYDMEGLLHFKEE